MLLAPNGTDAREAELIAERDHHIATARKRKALAVNAKNENGWMLFSTGADVARREAARVQSRIEWLRHPA